MGDKVVLVVGAGPGIGAAVARRFGREGYDVALVARSAGALERLADELRDSGVTAFWEGVDITDAPAFSEAVTRIGRQAGRVDVLHFNPSVYRPRDPLQLTPAELLSDVGVGVAALLTAVQAARPFMSSGARVTATGSMAADRPSAEACSLGVQKAALRNLVLSLDRVLAPDGIRAMSLTVNGVLGEGTPFAPVRVAEALFSAAGTPDDRWRAEVPFDG